MEMCKKERMKSCINYTVSLLSGGVLAPEWGGANNPVWGGDVEPLAGTRCSGWGQRKSLDVLCSSHFQEVVSRAHHSSPHHSCEVLLSFSYTATSSAYPYPSPLPAVLHPQFKPVLCGRVGNLMAEQTCYLNSPFCNDTIAALFNGSWN